jgi:hypothetical protein
MWIINNKSLKKIIKILGDVWWSMCKTIIKIKSRNNIKINYKMIKISDFNCEYI